MSSAQKKSEPEPASETPVVPPDEKKLSIEEKVFDPATHPLFRTTDEIPNNVIKQFIEWLEWYINNILLLMNYDKRGLNGLRTSILAIIKNIPKELKQRGSRISSTRGIIAQLNILEFDVNGRMQKINLHIVDNLEMILRVLILSDNSKFYLKKVLRDIVIAMSVMYRRVFISSEFRQTLINAGVMAPTASDAEGKRINDNNRNDEMNDDIVRKITENQKIETLINTLTEELKQSQKQTKDLKAEIVILTDQRRKLEEKLELLESKSTVTFEEKLELQIELKRWEEYATELSQIAEEQDKEKSAEISRLKAELEVYNNRRKKRRIVRINDEDLIESGAFRDDEKIEETIEKITKTEDEQRSFSTARKLLQRFLTVPKRWYDLAVGTSGPPQRGFFGQPHDFLAESPVSRANQQDEPFGDGKHDGPPDELKMPTSEFSDPNELNSPQFPGTPNPNDPVTVLFDRDYNLRIAAENKAVLPIAVAGAGLGVLGFGVISGISSFKSRYGTMAPRPAPPPTIPPSGGSPPPPPPPGDLLTSSTVFPKDIVLWKYAILIMLSGGLVWLGSDRVSRLLLTATAFLGTWYLAGPVSALVAAGVGYTVTEIESKD